MFDIDLCERLGEVDVTVLVEDRDFSSIFPYTRLIKIHHPELMYQFKKDESKYPPGWSLFDYHGVFRGSPNGSSYQETLEIISYFWWNSSKLADLMSKSHTVALGDYEFCKAMRAMNRLGYMTSRQEHGVMGREGYYAEMRYTYI